MKNKRKVIKTFIIIIFLLSLVILEISNWGEKGITKYNSDFKIFDMQWNYTVTSVYDSLKMIPREGIRHYIIYLVFDTIMTISFAGVQYYISIYVSRRSVILKVLTIMIALRVSCDLIENIILIFILTSFPIQYGSLIKIASINTKVKFILLLGFWIMIVYLLVVSLYKRVKIYKGEL